MGVSRRECAKIIGVSEAAIRKALKVGRISAEPDGNVDPEAVRKAWEKTTDPARTAVRTGAQGTQPSVPAAIEAQASTEALLARTRIREILAAEGVTIADGEELTFNHARTAEKIVQTWERDRAHAEAAGRMIDAAVAERRWADEMVKLRARFLAVSGKIAMRLSHLTPHEVQEIDQVVRDAMDEAAGDDVGAA